MMLRHTYIHRRNCKSIRSSRPRFVPFDTCGVYFCLRPWDHCGPGQIYLQIGYIIPGLIARLYSFQASFSQVKSTFINLRGPREYASRIASPIQSWALSQAAHRPRSAHPCRHGHSDI